MYCDMRDAQVIYVLVVNSDEDAQLFRLDERLKVSVSSVIPHATGDRNRVLSDQVSNQRNRPRPTLLSTMLALAFAAPIDGYPHDLFNAPGPPSPDDDGADPMEEDREPSRYAHRQGREYQHDLRRDRDDDDGAPPHPGPGRGGLNTHRGMDLGLEQTAPDDRGDENAQREEKVRADGKGSLSDLVPVRSPSPRLWAAMTPLI